MAESPEAMRRESRASYFSRRWHGEVPWAALLWRDMLGVGTVVNLTATLLALVAAIHGAPLALVALLHFAPLPYNVFLVAALWRIPDRPGVAAVVAVVWLAAVLVV